MFTPMDKEEIARYVEAENKKLNTPVKVGDILYNSWGYDMTINDFAVCLENTGKTLKMQMVAKKVIPSGSSSERAIPIIDQKYGNTFRLRITKRKDSPGWWYSGSYPYCMNQDKESKHSGSFFVWGGKPNYENHDD